MVKLIVGDPGSGKTKQMISMANEDAKSSSGTVVYLDYTDKHMLQLENNIRFIAFSEIGIDNFDHLYGFICGLNSANYDIQKIYIDGIIKTLEDGYENLASFLEKLEPVSEKYNVEIIITATVSDQGIINSVKKYID